MLTLLFCAQAIAPLPATPPVHANSEARRVIDRQLSSPPRIDPAAAGVGAEEADAIAAGYIASIGKKITPAEKKAQ